MPQLARHRIAGRPPAARQLAGFALTGGVTAGINIAIFVVTRIWCDPLPANLIAAAISTIVSTELNRRFTFRSTPGRGWRLHTQTLISVLYYAFSTSAALFILGLLIEHTTPIQESVAIAVTGTLAALGRFLILRNWVFTNDKRPKPEPIE